MHSHFQIPPEMFNGITKNDHAAYQNEVDSFVTWCDDANLILNIDKTKELIFDFKRKN